MYSGPLEEGLPVGHLFADHAGLVGGDPFYAIVKLTKCQPLPADGKRHSFSIITSGTTKRINVVIHSDSRKEAAKGHGEANAL
jgi:hypothetical protein